MNNSKVPQLEDIVLLRLSLMYGKIKSPDELGYNTYDFKVISYYDGEGEPSNQQVLVVPVNENIISGDAVSFRPFNFPSFNELCTNESFTTVKNIATYSGKMSSWVYIELICEISRPVIDPANDGCFCRVCKNWYPMAVANQSDGTLVCWLCRQYPVREFY
jgi:hypothetical protein